MIRHCVFLKLCADHDGPELTAIFEGLAELCAHLKGAGRFIGGRNLDVENKSQDFPAGFTIDFADIGALNVYANDERHKDLGARLCALCIDGADGITVFDIETDTGSGFSVG